MRGLHFPGPWMFHDVYCDCLLLKNDLLNWIVSNLSPLFRLNFAILLGFSTDLSWLPTGNAERAHCPPSEAPHRAAALFARPPDIRSPHGQLWPRHFDLRPSAPKSSLSWRILEAYLVRKTPSHWKICWRFFCVVNVQPKNPQFWKTTWNINVSPFSKIVLSSGKKSNHLFLPCSNRPQVAEMCGGTKSHQGGHVCHAQVRRAFEACTRMHIETCMARCLFVRYVTSSNPKQKYILNAIQSPQILFWFLLDW